MSTLDDVAQKIKGKTQKIKGSFKDNTGNRGDGTWDKVKGSVNETIADLKLKNRQSHP